MKKETPLVQMLFGERNLPDGDDGFAEYADATPPVRTAEDFKDLIAALDALEEQAAKELHPALIHMRDVFVHETTKQYVAASGVPEWIKYIQVNVTGDVERAIDDMLMRALAHGRTHIASQFGRTYAELPAMGKFPDEALRYFRQKKFYISGILSRDLTGDAQTMLLQAMKSGASVDDTVDKLQRMFEPLVGKDESIADWEQTKPARLATIVRTNTTDAYNQGVLVEMRGDEYDGMVKGFEYVAVLDNKTTPVCQFLDGAVFRRDDKRLDRLLPPNHFNCRSVVEPVLYGRRLAKGELISAKRFKQALDLIPPGFGGDR